MKLTIRILRIFIGIIFTFSGFVKAVDPIGTQIKFEDYFLAMGIEWLSPAALFFSFLMNAAEFSLGIMLIINTLPKFSVIAAIALMTVFTPLTLWLAIYNPVTDCGCFGDAITLTNWETFWKNIIILAILIFLLIKRNYLNSRLILKKEVFFSSVIFASAFIFEFYNIIKSPLIDFRPYAEGTNIIKNMEYPKNAEKDIYETKIVYKNLKSGDKKEFNIENCPYDDTLTWAFDTTINKLIKKGYEPPIHDFVISDLNGNDITENILSNKNYSFIIISNDLKESNEKEISKLKLIAKFAEENHLKYYCFTASGEKDIKRYSLRYPRSIKFFTADKKMLQTFVRSNPSLIILKNAVIIKKYSYFEIPGIENLKKYIK
jgi:uncharacterized membrane protein YphA (DoxX/SURF4 family)